jgi:hypothetical protein
VAGSREHGNEPLGSIKGGEFLDHMSGCQLLKEDCAEITVLHIELFIHLDCVYTNVCIVTCVGAAYKRPASSSQRIVFTGTSLLRL